MYKRESLYFQSKECNSESRPAHSRFTHMMDLKGKRCTPTDVKRSEIKKERGMSRTCRVSCVLPTYDRALKPA